MRKLIGALGALAMAAAALVATTPSAQGSVYLGIYAIKTLGNNYCIADSDDGLWMPVCNPRNRIGQQWDVNAPPNSRVFSNRGWVHDCIDDSVNGLQALTCNGTPYQQFKLVSQSDGSAYVVNIKTNGCLTFGSGNIYASKCRGLHSQRFVLVEI
ncbi:hypothetical protein ACIA58_35365 [Kribbella sp. NPDC051586]|uniref:hypothetical protein n=1 Tax=Kribbella sp. NPDC051586 TaxID=3364118 RepID=UPI0037B0186E